MHQADFEVNDFARVLCDPGAAFERRRVDDTVFGGE